MPNYSFELLDEEYYENQYVLPGKYEVCPKCGGAGKHDHEAFASGITAGEWAEWDQDDKESYLRGDYSVPCEECRGQRVVVVPDEDALNDEMRNALAIHRENLALKAQERAWERRNAALGIEY